MPASVSPPAAFADHVRAAAEHFLQTVLVVDDQASYGADEEVGVLEEPNPQEAAAAAVEGAEEPAPRPKGPLDARALVEEFARRGLVCSVLKPLVDELSEANGESQFQSIFLASASAADVVVLDWVLHDDQGDAAIALLRRLIDRDDPTGRGRLRLVTIYTGEPDLDGIFARLQAALGDEVDDCSDGASGGSVWLRCGGLKVIVLAKEGVHVSQEHADTIVPVETLPAIIVEQFSELTYGLIPTFTLRCLAIIRENAHHLLRKLSDRLDAPFLSHRIYTSDEDAQEFAVHLLSSELNSLLEAAEVARHLGPDVISSWMDEKLTEDSYELSPDTSLAREKVVELVEKGAVEGLPPGVGTGKLKKLKSVTRLFCESQEITDEVNHEFGRLSCLARNHPEPFPSPRPPKLTLGTVVGRKESGGSEWEYLLCVQPACDSVRLSEGTQFAFLPMRIDPQRFDVVALGPNSDRLFLQLAVGVRDLELFRFVPASDGRIHAKEDEGVYSITADDETVYVWVAQLRDFQAQRHANQISGELGRPGGDDYEWLRLSAR